MCEACNEAFYAETFGDTTVLDRQPRPADGQAQVSCEVCDRDASATVVMVRWQEVNVCRACLTHKEEMDKDEAASGGDGLAWRRERMEHQA